MYTRILEHVLLTPVEFFENKLRVLGPFSSGYRGRTAWLPVGPAQLASFCQACWAQLLAVQLLHCAGRAEWLRETITVQAFLEQACWLSSNSKDNFLYNSNTMTKFRNFNTDKKSNIYSLVRFYQFPECAFSGFFSPLISGSQISCHISVYKFLSFS